jgi:hypothetical protein
MKDKLIEKRDAVLASAEAIVATAKTEARDLTADEDAEIAKSLDEVRDLDAQIERHAELEKRAKEAADIRAKPMLMRHSSTTTSPPVSVFRAT